MANVLNHLLLICPTVTHQVYYCDSSGGLDVRPFTTSSGFTETAFMSSTRELSVALEYSGVKQGKAGTVLPPPSSPLSLFAAFSHPSSTKACQCTKLNVAEACWVRCFSTTAS
jgi:hypothetical protein